MKKEHLPHEGYVELPMEYWFDSVDGIHRYHNELFDQAEEAHAQKLAQIEKTRNDMIEALRRSKEARR